VDPFRRSTGLCWRDGLSCHKGGYVIWCVHDGLKLPDKNP
jgi:hypothetical protein